MDVALEARDAVVTKLRKQYPWMNTDAVNEMAAKVYNTLASGIEEQTPVMRASQDRLSFLSLPTEPRNRIYELALIKGECDTFEGQEKTIDVVWDGDWTCMNIEKLGRHQLWIKQPPLTKINRQIRSETLPIYYGMNTFEVSPGRWVFPRLLVCIERDASTQETAAVLKEEKDFQEVGRWLRAIGSDNAKLIRNFDVKVETGSNGSFTPVLSVLELHKDVISLALAMHFREMSVDIPVATGIMAREVAVDPNTNEELQDRERGWKRLHLRLNQTAVDGQSTVESTG